jgi:hypothetical protein
MPFERNYHGAAGGYDGSASHLLAEAKRYEDLCGEIGHFSCK